MPHTARTPQNALVEAAIAARLRLHQQHPIPLISTAYDIRITGGLAEIAACRTFRNEEAQSIEATLTLPLPVHAVLFELSARIGDRVLKGIARPRDSARDTYEAALDRGKTAVLHEELLRGIHMLSVGHVAPGAEVEVTLRFALPLSWTGSRALLRIPLTVGDVYGQSGLPDADELLIGGPVASAALTITVDCGSPVLLGGGRLDAGAARVPLNAPIVVEISGWSPRPLAGRAADGRNVSLSINPYEPGVARIDAAVLVDRSGSMAESCSATVPISKHAAVLHGLADAHRLLGCNDTLDLWEFDTAPRRIGKASAMDWRSLVPQLSGPQGGTEIGTAIAATLAAGARDILLVTDGRSHALDVQALAKSGARVTVVLIGEDSLDANVGHLAALTGGEIFVAEGADVSDAVTSALKSLRSAPAPLATSTIEAAEAVSSRCGGMHLAARWIEARSPDAAEPASRAVAAFAASLRIATLEAAEATKLAEAEGLVTHLTSLYLVDEESEVQDGMPLTRKLALPPRSEFQAAVLCAPSRSGMPQYRARATGGSVSKCVEVKRRRPLMEMVESPIALPADAASGRIDGAGAAAADRTPDALADLVAILPLIDWHADGPRLIDGDLRRLPPAVAAAIDTAADDERVIQRAAILSIEPRRLVIGLLALARGDRAALRAARRIFGKTPPTMVVSLGIKAGLIRDRGRVEASGSRA